MTREIAGGQILNVGLVTSTAAPRAQATIGFSTFSDAGKRLPEGRTPPSQRLSCFAWATAAALRRRPRSIGRIRLSRRVEATLRMP